MREFRTGSARVGGRGPPAREPAGRGHLRGSLGEGSGGELATCAGSSRARGPASARVGGRGPPAREPAGRGHLREEPAGRGHLRGCGRAATRPHPGPGPGVRGGVTWAGVATWWTTPVKYPRWLSRRSARCGGKQVNQQYTRCLRSVSGLSVRRESPPPHRARSRNGAGGTLVVRRRYAHPRGGWLLGARPAERVVRGGWMFGPRVPSMRGRWCGAAVPCAWATRLGASPVVGGGGWWREHTTYEGRGTTEPETWRSVGGGRSSAVAGP